MVDIDAETVKVLKGRRAERGSIALDFTRADAVVFGALDGSQRNPISVSQMFGEHRPTRVNAGGAVFPVGVSDGTRTRDIQDHNLTLYQLNYTHHGRGPAHKSAGPTSGDVDTSRSVASRPNRVPPVRLPRP